MPVAAGMQWNANASSGEDAMYDTRKKNVHELDGRRGSRGEGPNETGPNEHGDVGQVERQRGKRTCTARRSPRR